MSKEEQKVWEEHLKNMGNPFDLKYTIVGVEGNPCPAGYKVGDWIEYKHKDKTLEGNKGICLNGLPRIMGSMWRIRGPEPHCSGAYITTEGERYGRVMCECGGDGGPKLWWTARKIPRENMDGFLMTKEMLMELNDPDVYEVEAKIVKMEGRDDIQIKKCEGGWVVGDWIRWNPLTRAFTTSREDNGMCLPSLQKQLLYIIGMTYVPSWAEKDENGEPYIVFRCDSWADTQWEVRRIGEPLKGGRHRRPFMDEETDKSWKKGRNFLIKQLDIKDYRYNP
jgi:hypothetical protein